MLRIVRKEADEPLHCSAFVKPEDIICEGSDAEQSPKTIKEKHQRYEYYASLYLQGKLPIIQSASLRGPLDKESGWVNPWRSRSKKGTKAKERGRKYKTDSQSSSGMTSFNKSTHLNHRESDTFRKGGSEVEEKKDKGIIRDHKDADHFRHNPVKWQRCCLKDEQAVQRREPIILTGQWDESARETLEGDNIQYRKSGNAPKRISDSYWLKGMRNSKRARWDSSPASTPTPLPNSISERSSIERQISKSSTRHIETTDIPFMHSTNIFESDETSFNDEKIRSILQEKKGCSADVIDDDIRIGSRESALFSVDELPCKSAIVIKRRSSTNDQSSFTGYGPSSPVNSANSRKKMDMRASLSPHQDSLCPKTATRVTPKVALGLDEDDSFVTSFEPSSGYSDGFRYKRRQRKLEPLTRANTVSRNDLSLNQPRQSSQLARIGDQSIVRTLGSPFNSEIGNVDTNGHDFEEQSSRTGELEVENLSNWSEMAETLQHETEIQAREGEQNNSAPLSINQDDLESLNKTPCLPSVTAKFDGESATLRTPDDRPETSTIHEEKDPNVSQLSLKKNTDTLRIIADASSGHQEESELPDNSIKIATPTLFSQQTQTQSPWVAENLAPLPLIRSGDSVKTNSINEQDDLDELSFVELPDQSRPSEDKVVNSQRSARFTTPVDDEIMPFNEFLTPVISPKLRRDDHGEGATTFSELLDLATTHNPWAGNDKTLAKRNSTKRVSFGPLPEGDEDYQSQNSVPSKRPIGSPPPPVQSLRDLPERDSFKDSGSSFENHFRLASRYNQTKFDSPQRSPRVDAMAEAFIMADLHTLRPKDQSSTIESITHSSPKMREEQISNITPRDEECENPPASTERRSRRTTSAMDEVDVNALLGEMDDFFQEWDVETEIRNVTKLSQSKDSSQTALPLRRELLSSL
ncbi:hypothetical protein B7463_g1260, partial [Scytalidium lignicola]